jgi:hypothetical protein
MRLHCPGLKELSLKCNPISAKKSYRAVVFQRINTLIKLDGIALTDKDKERVKNDNVALTKDIIMESLKTLVKHLDYNKQGGTV